MGSHGYRWHYSLGETHMRTRILQPGYLVSLKSSIRGGPSYHRVDLGAETRPDGSTVNEWQTTRELQDPDEYERAVKVRSKCRAHVTGICSRSEFGLLCPTSREDALGDAISAARLLASAFNNGAQTCHVDMYAIAGRIADDDAEAARAVASEIRDLMTAIDSGIQAADPKAIRDAANKARSLGAMLSGEAAEKAQAAIKQAREAAREIVKRIVKSGENAATVINEIKTDAIGKARFAFLDFEEGSHEAAPVAPRALDLDYGEPDAPGLPFPELEIDPGDVSLDDIPQASVPQLEVE